MVRRRFYSEVEAGCGVQYSDLFFISCLICLFVYCSFRVETGCGGWALTVGKSLGLSFEGQKFDMPSVVVGGVQKLSFLLEASALVAQ